MQNFPVCFRENHTVFFLGVFVSYNFRHLLLTVGVFFHLFLIIGCCVNQLHTLYILYLSQKQPHHSSSFSLWLVVGTKSPLQVLGQHQLSWTSCKPATVSKPGWDLSCQWGAAVKYLPTSEGNLKSLEHLRQGEALMWRDCDSYGWFKYPGTRNCSLTPTRSHWSLWVCCFPISCWKWELMPLFPDGPREGCFPGITEFRCSQVLNQTFALVLTFHCKCLSLWRKKNGGYHGPLCVHPPAQLREEKDETLR